MSTKCSKEKCRAWATEDGFCFMHSAKQAEKRTLAQKMGGSVGKNPRDRILVPLEPFEVATTGDVAGLLTETINLVRAGKMDIRVGNCVGNLSNYLLKALEQSSLEARLEEVERIIFERRTGYGVK